MWWPQREAGTGGGGAHCWVKEDEKEFVWICWDFLEGRKVVHFQYVLRLTSSLTETQQFPTHLPTSDQKHTYTTCTSVPSRVDTM